GRRRLPHLLGLRPRRGRPLGHVQVARPGAERTQRDRPLVPAPRRVREGLALAYDEELAARIRALVAGEPSLTEQKMFGGLAFLVGGNMAVAASGQGGVLVRVDPEQSDELVGTTDAYVMEMRGRPTAGWLRVDSEH